MNDMQHNTNFEAYETAQKTMARPPACQLLGRTSINDLPDEIFLEILRCTGIDRVGQKDLYNLCLVNRRFKQVATELLYYRIEANQVDIFKLLRTIFQNPNLALSLRELELNPLETPPGGVQEQDIERIAAQIKALGLRKDHEDYWTRHLWFTRAKFDVCAAMLILHAPNVSNLELAEGNFGLDWPQYSGTYWSGIFDQETHIEAPSRLLQFHHLKRIEIYQDSIELKHVASLFSLKALEDLEIIGREIRRDSTFHASTPRKNTSRVKKLRVGGAIDPDVIAILITACRSLSTFAMQDEYGDSEDWEEDTDLTPIFEALQSHKADLRHLELCGTDVFAEYNTLGPYAQYFKGFNNVETLHLDARFVYHVSPPWPKLSDVLPSSIKKLRIDHTWLSILEDLISATGPLSTVIGNKSSIFPRLEYISIQRQSSHQQMDSALSHALRARGVEYQLFSQCIDWLDEHSDF